MSRCNPVKAVHLSSVVLVFHIVHLIFFHHPLEFHSQGEYSERAAARTIRAVLRVVAHCHSLGICHRDLKLSNFLLADPLDAASIKAVDFGTATFCKEGE